MWSGNILINIKWKENSLNKLKQFSCVDGTGLQYPTVDAVERFLAGENHTISSKQRNLLTESNKYG
jgi:hypothetical protein